MTTPRLRLWLGLAVGLTFLYLAFRNAEFDTIWRLLGAAALAPMLASVSLRVASLWLRALRWRTILRPLEVMSMHRAFRLVALGEISNGVLPIRGGDVVRVLLLSKEKPVSKAAGAASIVLEKLYDLGVVLVLLLATSVVLTSPAVVDLRLGWIAIGFAVVLLLLMVLARKGRVGQSSFPLAGVVARFRDGLRILQDGRQALRVFGESLVLWALSGLGLYLVIVALHLPVPWYAGFFVIGVSAIGSLLPTAPAAIGTTELLFVIGFQPFAVDKNSALACALLARGLQLVSLALAGVVAATQREGEMMREPSS